MKLRMSGNSIRLRLTPAEVARFAETGSVRSETAFGPSSKLAYELLASDNIADAAVTFESNMIRIVIPARNASLWAGGNEIGIYASHAIDADRHLKITIEKDFECLDPAGNEPGSILYPNPRKSGS